MNCDYPMVSIVVVNARGTVNLRRCLNSLFETEYSNFEVIVVDCLTHGIEEMLKSEFPKARIVHLDYDCGPAEQHNIGYRMSDPESKYIAFLDNDTEVTSGWLINLLTTLNSDETVGVLQPKLLFLNSKKRIDGSGDFMDYVGNTYSRGRFEIDLGQYDSKPEIFSARGAAFITIKALDLWDFIL